MTATAAPADPRDEARIRQTVLAVPTNADLGAFDAIAPLFGASVVIDYTSLWGGQAQLMTPRALMDAWRGVLPGFDATLHEIGDIAVQVIGDQARATCPIDARHWIDARCWRLKGRYAFELGKVGGRWRITRMTLTVAEESGDRSLVEVAAARAAERV